MQSTTYDLILYYSHLALEMHKMTSRLLKLYYSADHSNLTVLHWYRTLLKVSQSGTNFSRSHAPDLQGIYIHPTLNWNGPLLDSNTTTYFYFGGGYSGNIQLNDVLFEHIGCPFGCSLCNRPRNSCYFACDDTTIYLCHLRPLSAVKTCIQLFTIGTTLNNAFYWDCS